VYPSALKQVCTWSDHRRGQALGVMLGALTLGSALPYLVAAGGAASPTQVIVGTSVLATVGALLFALGASSGPHPFPRARFAVADVRHAVRSRAVMLANVAYVGHMWELYAMWGSMGLFISGLPGITSHRVASLWCSASWRREAPAVSWRERSATGLAVREAPHCAWSAQAPLRWRLGLCTAGLSGWSSRCASSGAFGDRGFRATVRGRRCAR
jgi:hypothetical protein